jgi:hypothetical protein
MASLVESIFVSDAHPLMLASNAMQSKIEIVLSDGASDEVFKRGNANIDICIESGLIRKYLLPVG